jgi:hypothetical protein
MTHALSHALPDGLSIPTRTLHHIELDHALLALFDQWPFPEGHWSCANYRETLVGSVTCVLRDRSIPASRALDRAFNDLRAELPPSDPRFFGFLNQLCRIEIELEAVTEFQILRRGLLDELRKLRRPVQASSRPAGWSAPGDGLDIEGGLD